MELLNKAMEYERCRAWESSRLTSIKIALEIAHTLSLARSLYFFPSSLFPLSLSVSLSLSPLGPPLPLSRAGSHPLPTESATSEGGQKIFRETSHANRRR
jgi:hypothetical protein